LTLAHFTTPSPTHTQTVSHSTESRRAPSAEPRVSKHRSDPPPLVPFQVIRYEGRGRDMNKIFKLIDILELLTPKCNIPRIWGSSKSQTDTFQKKIRFSLSFLILRLTETRTILNFNCLRVLKLQFLNALNHCTTPHFDRGFKVFHINQLEHVALPMAHDVIQ
jgi:hypothetical protein